jgi:hypothetical protein
MTCSSVYIILFSKKKEKKTHIHSFKVYLLYLKKNHVVKSCTKRGGGSRVPLLLFISSNSSLKRFYEKHKVQAIISYLVYHFLSLFCQLTEKFSRLGTTKVLTLFQSII